MKTPVVYKITSPSGRIYIGSTLDYKDRMAHYKRWKVQSQPKLYNSFKKYGINKHKFEIVAECNTDNMYAMERYYGELYDVLGRNGLNCVLPGYNEKKALRSKETLEKMSKAMTGKKASEETKEKMRKSQTGRKHRGATILKMKESNLNMKYVLCLRTGVFYYGTGDAADAYGMNRHTLKNKLNGSKNNNTHLIYA